MRDDERYDLRPFPKIRHAHLDVMRAGRRKNIIHGLVRFDVTDVSRAVRDRELSLTAFLVHCLGRAVHADPIVHAYRRRNQLVLFHDVDVNTQIEAELGGQKVVKSVVLRAVNRKSVEQLTAESAPPSGRSPATSGATAPPWRTWWCRPRCGRCSGGWSWRGRT